MHTVASLPGPRAPSLVNTLFFGFAPARFATRNAARFGAAYSVDAIHGRALFTADPEHLRRIFSSDSDALRTFAAMSLTSIFGGTSVIVTSGPPHKRLRKLLTPPLAGQRLRAFGTTMASLAEKHLAKVREGDVFRVHDLTTAFTLDVIARTVFGVDTEDEAAELHEVLSALVHDVPPIAIFFPRLQASWFPPWARYLRVQKRFAAWLTRKLAARRASPAEREDVLSLLLAARYDDGSALDDAEIRDQLVTLLLAGHETTAIALASAVHRILHNPDVLAKLREEITSHADTVEEIVRLPYLAAVLDETLRIDPIVTDVVRMPNAPFALDDALVAEKDELIVVFIEALHRDPSIYPEPERFRPERFLERKFSPQEFMPFGGGVRRCLGAAFSDYEAKIFLAAFVRALDVSLVHADPEPRVRRNVTMGPKRGVPVRVQRRLVP